MKRMRSIEIIDPPIYETEDSQAVKVPAKGSRKPSEDEQNQDTQQDRDYE